jgi:hypothetical protein
MRLVSQFEPTASPMTDTLVASESQTTHVSSSSVVTGIHQYATAHAVACALMAMILFFVTGLLTGRLPVAEGAGFDGAVYLSYIHTIATGSSVDGDPYRLSRMPGFLPAILAAYGGMRGESLLQFQSIFNAVLLALSSGLFLHMLLGWGLSSRAAWTATACLGLTWPWLIMPVFYPMLSDQTALVVSVLSIWLWDKHRSGPLALLSFASVWIMPGLFLVPLVLASVPKQSHRPGASRATMSPAINWTLKVLMALPLVAVGFMSFRIEDAEIVANPYGFNL